MENKMTGFFREFLRELTPPLVIWALFGVAALCPDILNPNSIRNGFVYYGQNSCNYSLKQMKENIENEKKKLGLEAIEIDVKAVSGIYSSYEKYDDNHYKIYLANSSVKGREKIRHEIYHIYQDKNNKDAAGFFHEWNATSYSIGGKVK